MPSTRPQENEIQTLVKAGTFEIPPVVPTTAFKEIKRYQSNLNDVLGTADPPPYSKHSPGKHDPTRPRNSSRTFKKWLKNLRHSPNQSQGENAPRSLNGSRYQSVIILIPEGYEYPIYNLDAKLGEREGNTSIEFQCSACSDGQSYFRRISVEIQLFHLNQGTPIEVPEFHPNTSQRLYQTEVQHNRSITGNVAVTGGGHGVTATAGVTGGEAQQFIRKEGVIFDGKRTSNSSLKWMWRADKVVKDGLEDRCEFWLTIPSVNKGVKAHFKVTASIARSWRYMEITLPPHKKLPPHSLELHFDDATTPT